MYLYSVFILLTVASITSAEELSSVRGTAVPGQNTPVIDFYQPQDAGASEFVLPLLYCSNCLGATITSTITVVETETITTGTWINPVTFADLAPAKRSPAPQPKFEWENRTTCPPGFSPRPCEFKGCDPIKTAEAEATPTPSPEANDRPHARGFVAPPHHNQKRSKYTSLITAYDAHYPEPTDTATEKFKRNTLHNQERKKYTSIITAYTKRTPETEPVPMSVALLPCPDHIPGSHGQHTKFACSPVTTKRPLEARHVTTETVVVDRSTTITKQSSSSTESTTHASSRPPLWGHGPVVPLSSGTKSTADELCGTCTVPLYIRLLGRGPPPLLILVM